MVVKEGVKMLEFFKKNFYAIIIGGLFIVCIYIWVGLIHSITIAANPIYSFDNVVTDSDAERFVAQFGWKINPKMLESEKFTIPKDFDVVYRNYNKLQKKIGLDLEKYKGKEVERRTYEVLNHPKSNLMKVRCNLLLYNNKVIAGDIMSVRLDGFMESLIGE